MMNQTQSEPINPMTKLIETLLPFSPKRTRDDAADLACSLLTNRITDPSFSAIELFDHLPMIAPEFFSSIDSLISDALEGPYDDSLLDLLADRAADAFNDEHALCVLLALEHDLT